MDTSGNVTLRGATGRLHCRLGAKIAGVISVLWGHLPGRVTFRVTLPGPFARTSPKTRTGPVVRQDLSATGPKEFAGSSSEGDVQGDVACPCCSRMEHHNQRRAVLCLPGVFAPCQQEV